MAAAAIADEASFVTIGIDREVFAVPVETVIEILDMRPVFRIPEAPAHLKGLIDVRGRAVPVIDLRTKLGIPAIAADQNTRMVVLDVPMEGRRLALGLVADRVFDVVAFNASQIEPPPDIGMRWNSDYIRGIGRRQDSFVVMLDLPKLFSSDAAHLVNARSSFPPSDGESHSSPSQAA
ncbi:MAG TPA: chemotaxis protein CheW [Pseudolabrys sp.]|nr:chemotaxis protein CheW [Pseudolabrys sp.]